jgi:signal transduction histidine kinase
MIRLWGSVAFRLALGYGILVISSMSVISAGLYLGTVGVLTRTTDAKLRSMSHQMVARFDAGGIAELRRQINYLLGDRVGDEDTEVYLLTAPDGREIAGNLSGWTPPPAESGRIEERRVTRDGRPSTSRLFLLRLPGGGMLVVGRDMRDRLKIERLIWQALLIGGGVSLLLAAAGALVFRRRLERRIAAIRGTALDIEAGDLSRRIPISPIPDEFSRLGHDINHMLDRIERLMDGVRHVSNAIAHDLRTPLGRIRGQLDEALRPGKGRGGLPVAARSAIAQIDEVIRVFDRLLQIAEAEAGTRRRLFASVLLAPIVRDVAELYDAEAEASGISLCCEIDEEAATHGDRDLLANALANLVDNALKYAGEGATVRVATLCGADSVSILVEDDGPGIPAAERARAVERFYRLDHSRSQPGNGLGLSIVAAVASLHCGAFLLDDAAPGLIARIVLPRADSPALGIPERVREASAE